MRTAQKSMPSMLALLILATASRAEPAYRSPIDVAFSPDGQTIAVTDHTAGVVAFLDAASGTIRGEVALEGHPAALVWDPDGSRIYAAETEAGSVAVVDVHRGKVVRRFEAGAWPIGLALAPRRGLLVATDFATDSVLLVDLETGETTGVLAASRQPFSAAVTPDESIAVVGNLIPAGSSTDADQSAAVTLIDLELRQVVAQIRLPAGSTGVREVAVEPHGRYAYVVHTLGRTNLPTSQIERGWVNTNALTIIDLEKRERAATVLLDYLLEGAADPWGVTIAPDSSRLWVTLAGAHQLATIHLCGLIPLIRGGASGLEDDIAALSRAGVIHRHPFPGNGPRGAAISPDGQTLAVAMYFSGGVVLLDAHALTTRAAINLGPQPEPDAARRGERIFHDATYCKQTWLSCATCHPDTRADGMNWDLLNDGLGNPKNVRSLVWSHKTPPVMSRGVRGNMEVASAAGFQHIEFQKISDADLEDVRAYLRSLEPAKSPFAVSDAPRRDQIERGREIFNLKSTGCAHCHPAPLFTDLKQYDVGTRGALDRSGTFDTPTLVEIWRTPPYLHDGSAETLHDVLFECNKDDKHGVTSQLTERELEDLIAYLKSL